MGKICPECGVDKNRMEWLENSYDHKHRAIQQNDRLARDNGLLRARVEMEKWLHSDGHSRMMRKIDKQRKAINKLEEKLKQVGKQPYKDEDAQPG